MAIFIDSASPEEVRHATALGFVAGVTTNPKLIARAGHPIEELIPELCDALGEGIVFYQLTGSTVEEREAEGRRIAALRPRRVGLKIPCTTENLALLPRLAGEGIVCAATAVFSAHQGLLACELGADFIIPYVNRATRLQGDGIALVAELAAVVASTGASSEILAASFHSLDEVVSATLAGADHVTLPPELLTSLGDHPLSEQAIDEFAQLTRR